MSRTIAHEPDKSFLVSAVSRKDRSAFANPLRIAASMFLGKFLSVII